MKNPRKPMQRLFTLTLGLAIGIGATCGARAADWRGSAGNFLWNDAGNWNPAAIPGVEAITINSGTSSENPVVIGVGVVATPTTLTLGSASTDSGYLLVEGGELSASSGTTIGNYGYGEFVNRGGDVYLRRLDIGCENGIGNFIHESGTLVICTNGATGQDEFYIGNKGNGYFKADANFIVGGTRTTFIGYGSNRSETSPPMECIMELGSNCTAKVNSISIGYTPNSHAQLLLRGATLEPTTIAVGANSLASGILRGWGKIQGGKITLSEKIIADAEGVAGRDLDLRYYYLNATLDHPGVNSGWFAVNKGRILFHEFEITSNGGNVTYPAGDRESNPRYDSMNSAKITLNGKQIGWVKPFLVASDHPSVPDTGFPQSSIKTVWNFETPSFNTANIDFRYDETAVDDINRMKIIRYNPNKQAWDNVKTTHANRRFTATGLLPHADGADPSANTHLGFFALIELPRPTILILR